MFKIEKAICKSKRFYALKVRKDDGQFVWIFYDSKSGQAEPLTFP